MSKTKFFLLWGSLKAKLIRKLSAVFLPFIIMAVFMIIRAATVNHQENHYRFVGTNKIV